jgi:hypothetical protein
MIIDNSKHLSEEQFSDFAFGAEPFGDAAAHLAECPQCSEELAKFVAAMTEFGVAALGWSESRSPLSMRQLALKATPRPRFVVATWALAAGFLLAAGTSIMTHRENSSVPEVSSTAVAAPAVQAADCSETEIAQDNKLMQDVNMAIGTGEPSPFRQYGLTRVDASRSRSHMGSRSQ